MNESTTHAPDLPRSEPRHDPVSVCTLPADRLSDRLAWIRSEILPYVVTRKPIEDGVAWELEDAPGLAERLDQLVARERECCSGIRFQHRPSQTKGRRRLEVHGIDPGSAIFADAERSAGRRPGVARALATATGVGSLISLVVCCALPLAAAAIFGAVAAVPFASLDQPWIIAGVAILSGAAAFVWQRRS